MKRKYKVVAKKMRIFGGKRITEKFRLIYKHTENFPNDLMEKVYKMMTLLHYNPKMFNYVVTNIS